jgi:hypothetical protein
MPHAFDSLRRELDLWGAAGRVAAFWWRDDDAVAPTRALSRLLGLSDGFGVEIGVAVIPACVEDALSGALLPHAGAVVLQHGYSHTNHARPGEPAVECGGHRPLEAVLEELRIGKERLAPLFGSRFAEVMAAPWNRIETPVVGAFAALGFRGVSAFGPRRAIESKKRLVVANTHVDPINWKERRFAGDEKAVSGIVGELKDRRLGARESAADDIAEPDEPLGLLTHHLDHDEGLWGFLEAFLALTSAHPAARWLTIDEAFTATYRDAREETR